jgi:hypothetical protein
MQSAFGRPWARRSAGVIAGSGRPDLAEQDEWGSRVSVSLMVTASAGTAETADGVSPARSSKPDDAESPVTPSNGL